MTFTNRSIDQKDRERILAMVADSNIAEDTLLETECCYCQWGEIRKRTDRLFPDIPVVFFTAWCCVCGTRIDQDAFIR